MKVRVIEKKICIVYIEKEVTINRSNSIGRHYEDVCARSIFSNSLVK